MCANVFFTRSLCLGKNVVAKEGLTRLTSGGASMPRADVAHYMIRCVKDGLHLGQRVAIGLSGQT